jgi:CheY-like chemotaxis protein
VIDDDEGIRRVMRRALDDHEVVTANDGVAALTLLATSPDFDLILCDIVMPNMGGVEFWHVMAATRPDILDSIVFMTGGALASEDERFLGAGIVHVLRKPFAFGMLRQFVDARVEARLSP